MRKCYDPETIGHFAPLKPCFRQTNFDGIFVNLKLSVKKPRISRAVIKTIKFKRETELSENKIVNYLEARLDQEYTSPALKRHDLLEFSKLPNENFVS